ncbi:unnamed protein product [Dibothriocephalus latus]|uniref:Uncharacterized protein n=1 Tax=Dibothriocephalus latus TaxID=60516 RepID=A0A3P6PK75_DIBLA|nr:unnamed protein product [Dibothriocephalus latus]
MSSPNLCPKRALFLAKKVFILLFLGTLIEKLTDFISDVDGEGEGGGEGEDGEGEGEGEDFEEGEGEGDSGEGAPEGGEAAPAEA